MEEELDENFEFLCPDCEAINYIYSSLDEIRNEKQHVRGMICSECGHCIIIRFSKEYDNFVAYTLLDALKNLSEKIKKSRKILNEQLKRSRL